LITPGIFIPQFYSDPQAKGDHWDLEVQVIP